MTDHGLIRPHSALCLHRRRDFAVLDSQPLNSLGNERVSVV